LKGGIDLTNRNTANKKPQDSVKSKFYTLAKGKAYPIENAERAWQVTRNTLRRHARELNALLFVEVAPEDWKECVIYPPGK